MGRCGSVSVPLCSLVQHVRITCFGAIGLHSRPQRTLLKATLLETIQRATTPSSEPVSGGSVGFVGPSVAPIDEEVETAVVALLELWSDVVEYQPALMDIFLRVSLEA